MGNAQKKNRQKLKLDDVSQGTDPQLGLHWPFKEESRNLDQKTAVGDCKF